MSYDDKYKLIKFFYDKLPGTWTLCHTKGGPIGKLEIIEFLNSEEG